MTKFLTCTLKELSIQIKVGLLTLLCIANTSWAAENPGELQFQVVNKNKSSNGLVVLLHGCGQSADQFMHASGFKLQALDKNVALLGVTQSQNNNLQACFNWFSELDNKDGQGEFASIINAINKEVADLKDKPVYIVGFSAGGAMASAILLQRPDLFTGAGIISGVPYPCANSLVQAISCMKNGPTDAASDLAMSVNGVFSKNLAQKQLENGKKVSLWPTLEVFTGTSDPVVNPINGQIMAAQYAVLTNSQVSQTDQTKPFAENTASTTFWHNKNVNKALIKLTKFEGLGHSMPITKPVNIPFYDAVPKGVAERLMDSWFH